MKKVFYLLLLIISPMLHTEEINKKVPIYICTGTDYKYFPYLLNLIGSLFRVDYENIEEIAVFDLGMHKSQRNHVSSIKKVTVYDVELTHPDILKPVK